MQYETIRKDRVFNIIKSIEGLAKKEAKDCCDITPDYIEGWQNSLWLLKRELKKEKWKMKNTKVKNKIINILGYSKNIILYISLIISVLVLINNDFLFNNFIFCSLWYEREAPLYGFCLCRGCWHWFFRC